MDGLARLRVRVVTSGLLETVFLLVGFNEIKMFIVLNVGVLNVHQTIYTLFTKIVWYSLTLAFLAGNFAHHFFWSSCSLPHILK